ncbi:hypothetical protein DRP05_11700 [Archaeoglobales archaeon]|nr:MAG: hypothetical protein DRP05_11700 [Archaeoglobales archaeon]
MAKDIFEILEKGLRNLPIHQKMVRYDKLASDEVNDALTEVTPDQVSYASAMRTINVVIFDGKLKSFSQVVDNVLSLNRSLYRKGREEWVKGIAEEAEKLQPQQPVIVQSDDERTGLIKRFFGLFRRRSKVKGG